jgi:electron transport complex protein RnfC
MGGAAFPSHVKLKSQPEKPIDSFILNGCECEPYLTCDHRIMLEKTEQILQGMTIAMKLLKVEKAYLGIEINKSDAIEGFQTLIKAGGYPVQVVPLKVKYPQGGEKLLIKAILNRKVPAGGLPGDVGVIVHNVGTMLAVKEAVIDGRPLISRVVSVTGHGITTPKNLEVRVGTPLRNLIDFCGGLKATANQIIMGGPMMGFSQFELSVPIVKSTGGIVCTQFQKEKEENIYPCIRCNSCVSACPMFLLPNRLSRLVEKGFYQETEQLGILTCIECGSCSFVCPSRIPILQWLQVGKYKVFERKRKSAV